MIQLLQCDVCSKMETTMTEFIIPTYRYERINTCLGDKFQKGVYPISLHICSKCQERIADFMQSIGGLNYDVH